jgi:hypothetical protein
VLHFENNNTSFSNSDKFWKIRRVFNIFNWRFGAVYNPTQELSVDESLVLWKGHHSLRRYIPSKADKWGLKFYAVAESCLGYILGLLVDEGKETVFSFQHEFKGLQKPGDYVIQLMKPYFVLGHILVVDNFHTELVLFKYLLLNKVSCIGTVRKGRHLFLPKASKATYKAKDKGKIVWKYFKEFVAFCWMDKREVRIVIYSNNACNTRRRQARNCAFVQPRHAWR